MATPFSRGPAPPRVSFLLSPAPFPGDGQSEGQEGGLPGNGRRDDDGAPLPRGDVADGEGAAAAEPTRPLRAGRARALPASRRALRQRPLPGGLSPRCVESGGGASRGRGLSWG